MLLPYFPMLEFSGMSFVKDFRDICNLFVIDWFTVKFSINLLTYS